MGLIIFAWVLVIAICIFDTFNRIRARKAARIRERNELKH
jgi:hypothetical protein